MINFFKIIFYFFYREYKISLNGFHTILTNIIFFFISIFIFIFSIGPNKEILSLMGVGIIWTLLLLSSTLSLRKFYQEDFESGNLILLHLNGLSYELITILKTISHFIFVQIPFLISIPVASILLDLSIEKVYSILLSFTFGSLILSCLGSISSSMNLLNSRNYLLGSVIVMIFSIPIIIFSISLINIQSDNSSIINILIGILLIIFAINPWASSSCIRLAIQNS